MKVFDKTFAYLTGALDARFKRHEIISSNIANLDTPGYQPRDLDVKEATWSYFERYMADASDGAGTAYSVAEHSVSIDPVVHQNSEERAEDMGAETNRHVIGEEGSVVDLDVNMAALAENAIEYEALTNTLRKKFGLLKYVLSGGHG